LNPTVLVGAQEGVTLDNFDGFRGREAGVISGGNREEDELGIEVDNPFGGGLTDPYRQLRVA